MSPSSIRLRHVARINPPPSLIKHLPSDTTVSFVPMEAVGEWGGLNLERTKELSEIGTGYTYFENGDVVVAKITPCFENGKGALAQELVSGVGFGTSELHVIRPGAEVHDRFLFYLTISPEFRKWGEAEMYGAGGQKRVPTGFVADFPIPTFSLGIQRTIADFLDRKTAAIDELIRKKERLIELLQEKRQALITQAVTKGLDPNVPMKDSGIEWLGEIPAHWACGEVRRFTADHRQGYYTNEGYVDSGTRLARITDIDDFGDISFDGMPHLEVSAAIRNSFAVKVNDFLFARSGTIGRFAWVRKPESAIFASYLIRFRFNAMVEPGLMCLLFMSDFFQQGLRRCHHGGANQNVHAEDIKSQVVPMPPMNEQKAIVADVFPTIARLRRLERHTIASMTRIREYRQALISAAVTGQLDIPEEPTP